jgi:hypothetical protein
MLSDIIRSAVVPKHTEYAEENFGPIFRVNSFTHLTERDLSKGSKNDF